MTRTAALNSIYELARIDSRVVFIGSDLAPNTLANFKKDFPDRYFMEGIQEQNIIGLAAGLALEGFIPYINNIATFLTRRCFEQIVLDICSHNLPIRLLGNGGGLVYAPLGQTHTGIDDISIMRTIPGMSVVCCSDNEEMKAMMAKTLDYPSPLYIRLAKDTDPIIEKVCNPEFIIGKAYDVEVTDSNFDNVVIFSTGIMTKKAIETRGKLPHKQFKDSVQIIHVPTIKPLDAKKVICHARQAKLVVTMEEGILIGGLGSAVLECLADNNMQVPVLRFGLPDKFPHHYGEQIDLLETYGLTPEVMAAKIKERYDSL